MNIADLRQEYMRAGLSEAQADADPMRQFERWFEDALRATLPLPNAMTLATVTPAGAPSARIVLLKGVEQGGFLFYTNYLSRKGRELERRAQACLLLLWSELERQVRIDGAVAKSHCGGVRRLLCDAPARRAALRLGVGAERNRALEGSARKGDGRDAPPAWGNSRRARRTGAATASMPQRNRVLAGPQRPPARPAASIGARASSWTIERLSP